MYFVILVIFNFLYEINFNFKTVTPPNTPSLTKLTKEQRTCQLSTPLRFASLSLRVELSSCDGSITLSYRWHGTAAPHLLVWSGALQLTIFSCSLPRTPIKPYACLHSMIAQRHNRQSVHRVMCMLACTHGIVAPRGCMHD